MPDFIGAIDQGTTSTRFMVFDHDGRVVGRHQLEHEQLLPRPGWVEHDPLEIWDRTQRVVLGGLADAGLVGSDLRALGVTNQRETVVVWDRQTGQPYGNAIVWQDLRTEPIIRGLQRDGADVLIKARTGLPPATYFSAAKVQWILEHVPGARDGAQRGDALVGTVDTWLVWNLTGGSRGGRHVTDVTNASRTMLMDLESLEWDARLAALFGISEEMLPQIASSADAQAYGVTAVDGPFGAAVPIAAVLGDQHAALIGHGCFATGSVKNTYGTGNFLLMNTGRELLRSTHGLLTTVAYRFAGEPAAYALEGSVAVTGAAVQWLRDQLGIIEHAADSETLAATVPDSGGVCFVPAFSGLFAPHWRSDARGVIVGLTRFSHRGHLARAVLEAACYQSREVVEAMERDTGLHLEELRVDGGMSANAVCMQLQSDILGIPVSRPCVAETTALGAAYAAGLAVGFWQDHEEVRRHAQEAGRWKPTWTSAQRTAGYARWQRAVTRSFGLADPS